MDSLITVAATYRRRAGLGEGDSAARVIDGLTELFPRLVLMPCDLPGGRLFSVERLGHVIYYDRRLRGWERARTQGHELAHLILLEEGWALPRPGRNGGNRTRLVQFWDAKEESRCERLLGLLLAPLHELSAEETAEAPG